MSLLEQERIYADTMTDEEREFLAGRSLEELTGLSDNEVQAFIDTQSVEIAHQEQGTPTSILATIAVHC
jgi:hypothetical protein